MIKARLRGELRPEMTPREREVLHWRAAGFSRKEIAHWLGISKHTVKGHLANIYARTGTTSITEAIVLFHEQPRIYVSGYSDR